MKYTDDILPIIRQEVERCAGHALLSPTDFQTTADEIVRAAKRPLSATTLMRIWGYVRDTGETYRPGNYTLSTIAIYLGYRDVEDFAKGQLGEVQSQGYRGESVNAVDIEEGTCVELTWDPGRRCVWRKLRGTEFEVTEAENSTLHKGDRVECASLTQEAPLYCRRVRREGAEAFTYVAGSKTGVRFSFEL